VAKLWGSRFKAGTDKLADQFSFSISYDYRLAEYDVIGGIAHAKMLGQSRIISLNDSKKIVGGLQKILKRINDGKFRVNPKEEDIHSQVQSELKKLIGSAADKLHTARSRNDLVVLDVKLYCIDQMNNIISLLTDLQKSILGLALRHQDVIMPAYTHLQAAQVVLLAHHLLAYVEMIERDKSRLNDAGNRLATMPLGSCALSGTTLKIDRKSVARELKFNAVTENSIDSVSDRDFIAELLSGLAIAGMHFSRISEDLILWSTKEFNFVSIDWSLCTGSSIMPHKKNPDILELIRGETATLYANLQRVLVLMKGLPLTYNRDMQLDKPALFESVEKIIIMAQLLSKTFLTLKVKSDILKVQVNHEPLFSVDIMEYLIKKGVSYREAHDALGRMIKECTDEEIKLSELSLTHLKTFSPRFEGDVKKLFNPEMSVKMKQSYGSTNPIFVKARLQFWKKKLK
jgi:argininosuccinate lyase